MFTVFSTVHCFPFAVASPSLSPLPALTILPPLSFHFLLPHFSSTSGFRRAPPGPLVRQAAKIWIRTIYTIKCTHSLFNLRRSRAVTKAIQKQSRTQNQFFVNGWVRHYGNVASLFSNEASEVLKRRSLFDFVLGGGQFSFAKGLLRGRGNGHCRWIRGGARGFGCGTKGGRIFGFSLSQVRSHSVVHFLFVGTGGLFFDALQEGDVLYGYDSTQNGFGTMGRHVTVKFVKDAVESDYRIRTWQDG